MAFILLLAAMAPILFASLPRKLIWFSFAYPIIAYVLIWGLFGLEPVETNSFGGFLITMILGAESVVVALVFGVVLALGRQYGIGLTKVFCSVFTTLFDRIPIYVLLVAAALLQNFFLPPGYWIPLFTTLISVLGLAGAAKFSVVIRRELKAISQWQLESASALGLSAKKAFWLVTLPLAFKRSIPQMAAEAAIVFQNTAIISLIGVIDPVKLLYVVNGTAQWNGILWELYIGIALLYWIISFSIMSYSKYYAQKLEQEQFASLTNGIS